MKTHVLYLVGLLACPFLFSQILTVNTGASVSVASGSSINLDGLVIAPADTYVISGANSVSRSITAATAGGNNSVLRVYSTSALLSGFTGTLTFSYLEGELNDIVEGDLVLEQHALLSEMEQLLFDRCRCCLGDLHLGLGLGLGFGLSRRPRVSAPASARPSPSPWHRGPPALPPRRRGVFASAPPPMRRWPPAPC